MPCVRTVVFRLCCENFRFSREATIRCCVRPAVPVGILQPPPAASMHGSRGSGLALARSARQTGKVGDQPESKSDTATRDTAIATSSGMRVLYHKSQSRCGGISGRVLCQSERNFKFCLGCQRQMLDSRLVEVAIPPVPYPPRGGTCVYFVKASSGGRPASSNASTPRAGPCGRLRRRFATCPPKQSFFGASRALAARDSRH